MDPNVRFPELTTDNILSFENYLPAEKLVRIEEEHVFGYGAVVEDYASGVLLMEYDPEEAVLEILYLYVDEEVRKQGIGKELLQMAKSEARLRGAVTLELMYLYPQEIGMQRFLAGHGFSEFLRGNRTEVNVGNESMEEGEFRLAIWELFPEEETVPTADAIKREKIPDYSAMSPRYEALLNLCDDMELAAEMEYPGEESAFLRLTGTRNPEIRFAARSSEAGYESFSLMGYASFFFDAAEEEEWKKKYLSWQDRQEVLSGTFRDGEGRIDFTAGLPLDDGMDEDECRIFLGNFVEGILDLTGKKGGAA